MPFQKGNKAAVGSGGPHKDKPWAAALRIVGARETVGGKPRLVALAEKCFEAAEAGDISAIKEIGDRHDGKPASETTLRVRNELDTMTDAELREFIGRELEAQRGSGITASERPHSAKPH